mgnify:CR=1 FL=1
MGRKLFLHICCAPCSIYTLRTLRDAGNLVTGYFYNPNIHPYMEFLKRLETIRSYAKVSMMPLTVDDSYELETFLEGALKNGKDRCLFCYRMRLEKTFRKAKDGGFDAVSTTLLYSKYQRHDDIKSICNDLSGEYGVDFLYRDFRIGWVEGVRESKLINMYRQQYCGCIFSEKERYRRGG